MQQHAEQHGPRDDEHDLLGRSDRGLLEDEQPEQDRCQPSRAEPAEKQVCLPTQLRPELGEGDREDPNHGQAQEGVEDDVGANLAEARSCNGGAEYEEGEQRQ